MNRHFWDRFGAAILLTVINGAVQGLVNSQNSGGSVVVSPSTHHRCHDRSPAQHGQHSAHGHQGPGRSDPGVRRAGCGFPVRLCAASRECGVCSASRCHAMSAQPDTLDLPTASALELNLRALRPILSDPEVTELCINRPGEAFLETRQRLGAPGAAVCGL